MEINFKISSDDIQLNEKDIQKSFEKNLSKIEEGLTYIDSSVIIGTGLIDTLAIDEEGKPVIIEYKINSRFDKDGLVQLMDYLSWFKKTEANILLLKDYIKNKDKKIEEVKTEIRLFLVIPEIEDERVLNACYSINNYIKIWGFKLLNEGENVTIVPYEILDNEEIASIPTTLINLSEEEILNNFSSWKSLYNIVKEYAVSLNKNIGIQPRGDNQITFRANRIFLRLRFRKKKGLMLDMGEVKGIEDPKFKYWKDSNWGYVHIRSQEEFTDEVKEWIKKSYLSG